MRYSIVIPTCNRRESLAEVLDALEAQRDAPDFEVVVVDDGSTDRTWEWLQARSFHVPNTLHRQRHAGPARARNEALARANGRRIAFLGDDTVPEVDWLSRHWQRVRGIAEDDGERTAVLGNTRWHPRVRTTPFLEYINDHGLQFGYARIGDPTSLSFNFFYASNLSVSRALLGDRPFNEEFPFPAWEDTELGYRLTRRGMKLIYEPLARVSHDHPTDLGSFAKRQERCGYAAVTLYRLHPELGGLVGLRKDAPPALPSHAVHRCLEWVASRTQAWLSTPALWKRVLRYHYVRGVHEAWNAWRREARAEAPATSGVGGR